MIRQEMLAQLKNQRTWRLILLSLARPGMYTAHDIKIISKHSGDHKAFVNLLITLMHVTAIRDFTFFFRLSPRST